MSHPPGWTRRRFLARTGGATAALALGSALPGCAAHTGYAVPASAPRFILLSDTHSAYDRYPLILSALDQYRETHPAADLLILFNGDLFERGNPMALRGEGSVDLDFMAALRRRAPVVFNLGNHEGALTSVAEAVTRLRALDITVISTIRDRGTGRELAPPWTELTIGGVAATIGGLATSDMATYRAEIRDALSVPHGPDVITAQTPGLVGDTPLRILLTHEGLADDRQILPRLPDGTLILGGHDHLHFQHRENATLYLHVGSWGTHLTVTTPALVGEGRSGGWQVEEILLTEEMTPNPEMARRVSEARESHLLPEDERPILRTPRPFPLEEAARQAVEAVRSRGGGHAAFVANTTFGSGLPGGPVPQYRFHSFLRFDNDLYRLSVPGRELARLLRGANQFGALPFHERTGEFLVAAGPDPQSLESEGRYTIVVDGWIRLNGARYLGPMGAQPDGFELLEESALRRWVAEGLSA